MRVIRLYLDQNLAKGDVVKLNDANRHHAINVLRINKKSLLKLFNGNGHDYTCEILTCNKKTIELKITGEKIIEKESSLTTKLFLGVSKSTHMDYAIQKSVEAGITSIHPLITERTISKLSEKTRSNKVQHWHRIIINACEQCGRAVIPTLHDIAVPADLPDLLADEYGFIFDSDAHQSLIDFSQDTITSLCLLIGPEGGLTKSEISSAIEKGYKSVMIGPRVLRTETAALSATICSQLLWGDVSKITK